jgi:hypothetical protein
MPRFNEKSLVEDYFISELRKRGWSSAKQNTTNAAAFSIKRAF